MTVRPQQALQLDPIKQIFQAPLSRRHRDRAASNLHSRPSQVHRLQTSCTISVLSDASVDQNITLPAHLDALRDLECE